MTEGLHHSLRAEIASGTIRRILLVRFARLGDLLFTTPAIRILGQALPEARLDYLTTRYAAGVVTAHPRLSKILHHDRKWHHPGYLVRKRRLRQEIAREQYDLAVVFEAKGVTRRMIHDLLSAAGVRHVVSRDTFDAPFCGPPPVHACERHMSLLAMLDIPPDTESYELHFSPEDAGRADELLGESGISPGSGTPLVGIQVGCHYSMWPSWIFWNQTYKYHKTWPYDRFARLGSALADSPGARMIITGAGVERRIGDEIIQQAELPADLGPVNLAGRTSVGTLAALIKRLDLFVSVDTGSMHMATALGVPTVALFGPTDPARHGPYRRPEVATVLRSGIECSPCKKQDRKRCPRNRCMQELAVEEVLEAVRLRLA